MMTEEEFRDLVRRVRGGDNQAAADLVRRFEPEIRLEVRVRLRLRHPRLRRVLDSLDVCQLVLASFFVRAAAGQYDLESPEQLLGLLRGMARNKLADESKFHQRQRRDLRREHGEEVALVDPPEQRQTPSGLVANRELLETVRGRLSDEERLLMDRRCQGQEWGAIAAELGGTAEGRRKQFDRAMDRVVQELGLEAEV